jgi:hypothetical protein
MINCRVPLSAAAWVNKLFVPVYIHHGELLLSYGLLAKHARRPRDQRQTDLSLLCFGQHLWSPGENRSFGKDLFLVDAMSKVPVGLVPDLMPDEHVSAQHYAWVTRRIHNGFCEDTGDNNMNIIEYPLSSLTIPAALCLMWLKRFPLDSK